MQAADQKEERVLTRSESDFVKKEKEKFGDKNTPRIFAVRFKKSGSSSKKSGYEAKKKSSKNSRKIWLNKQRLLPLQPTSKKW